jgi:hypothetical protein
MPAEDDLVRLPADADGLQEWVADQGEQMLVRLSDTSFKTTDKRRRDQLSEQQLQQLWETTGNPIGMTIDEFRARYETYGIGGLPEPVLPAAKEMVARVEERDAIRLAVRQDHPELDDADVEMLATNLELAGWTPPAPQVTVSRTPPADPRVGDLWLQILEVVADRERRLAEYQGVATTLVLPVVLGTCALVMWLSGVWPF